MILSGTVNGNATVGELTRLSTRSNQSFNDYDSSIIRSVFYPMGWFGNNESASGTAEYLGDLEAYSSRSSGIFYGMVDDNLRGKSSIQKVTVNRLMTGMTD